MLCAVFAMACGKTEPAPSAAAPAAPAAPAPEGVAASAGTPSTGPIGKDFGDLKRRVSRWFEGELAAGAGVACSDQDKILDPAGRVAFRNGEAATPRGGLSALVNTATLEAQDFGADEKVIATLRVTDSATDRRFGVLLTRASGWSTGSLSNLNDTPIHACVRDGAGQASRPPVTATALELLDGLSGTFECSVVLSKPGKLERRRHNYRFAGTTFVMDDISVDLATATTAILTVDNPTPDGATIAMSYAAELPGDRMLVVSRVNGRAVDSVKLQWPRGEMAYECAPKD